MSPEISTALMLLAIGMITVFVVLLMVVSTGNLLIRVVNKLASKVSTELSNQTVAILTATVEEITEGKGSITKIEKD